MKTLFVTAALFILPLAAYAEDPVKEMPAGLYKIDPTHASLIWKVNHLGLSNYTARFTDFSADLEFDPLSLEKSTLSVKIDPTSVRTDYPHPETKDFDKKLSEGEEWFNSNSFPAITFKSTELKVTGEKTGTVTGDLTLLGQTKPVTLDVTFNAAMKEMPYSKKPALGFSATTSIKRSDWGFNTYLPMIGDQVDIIIETEFSKAD